MDTMDIEMGKTQTCWTCVVFWPNLHSRLRVPSETGIVSGLNHWAQQDLQQYNCVVYYSYAQWAGLADPRQFVSLAPFPSIGA